MRKWQVIERILNRLGGPTSGHYGHKGAPGIGGSSSTIGALGSFGTWTEARSKELVSVAQKEYPEFYSRMVEHVGEAATIADEFVPGSSLKESEVPAEIALLGQWDLRGRLDGDTHVKLYSGLYKHGRPGAPQPDSQEIQDRLERKGFGPMTSFTTNPDTAYGFSEGVGSVVISTLPISDVRVSHFVVPSMGRAFGGTELEFLVSPTTKNSLFNVRSADRFERVVNTYKTKGYSPKRLIGYNYARPGHTWKGE